MKRSGIITLLTDFGLADPYVAMMKGVILSINPRAVIVDISHQIRAGTILYASSLLSETFPFFPEGTVHTAVVDPGVGSDRRAVCIEAGGHFFVGPDNGIFWPIVDKNRDAKIIHLTEEGYFLRHVTRTFHGREVFAPVAAHLTLSVDPDKMGPVIDDPVKLKTPAPFIKDNILYGHVIRVDYFGNLITDIGHNDLAGYLKKSQPTVQVGSLKVRGIDNIYSDVGRGEALALINSSDLLEIAVNLGRASEYTGIDPYEILGASVKVSRSV